MRWLIELFATRQEAEAIVGDLHEERTQIVASQGDGRARRWYLRQAARTVAHLALSPFRQAPFSTIGLGILALALTWPLTWMTAWMAAQLVVRVNVYEYVPARLFWQSASLMSPFLLGFLNAWIMRRRAMSTALAAFVVLTVIVSVIDPFIAVVVFPPRSYHTVPFFATRALVLLGGWGVTLLAGTAIGIKLMRITLRDHAPVESAG